MKINRQRPKSLPAISRSSLPSSIQRQSLPVISKQPLSTPKPITPSLIYSPAKSKESSQSSQSSQSTNSPMRSPQPSAKINVILPVDLLQYDALLLQTYTVPVKLIAINYIYLIYTIIYSFCNNIKNILERINDVDYLQPPLFKKTAIERLITLKKFILEEQYKYKALDGSIIHIDDKYALIKMLVKKITIDTEGDLYDYLRVYLRELKYDPKRIKDTTDRTWKSLRNIHRDDKLQSYIDRNIFTPKIRSKIISWFDNINIEIVNNKLKSQFKMIEELINILNDIWDDEKTKEEFIKFILKTQKTSGIQSGGMLSFLRSNRVLPESDQVAPMNMRAKTGRSQQIIKLYNSIRPRTNRVLPEQVLQLHMYRRVYIINFQNILDFISLLKSYLIEVNDKMIKRYNNNLIRDDAKEYIHLYKEKKMILAKDPEYKDNREWIRINERKQGQALLTKKDEDEFEKTYKEKIDEEFKNFDKKPDRKKRYNEYKLKKLPTFTEMKQHNEDYIASYLRGRRTKLKFKEIGSNHIKFHLDNNVKFIKDRCNSVEKELVHLFP